MLSVVLTQLLYDATEVGLSLLTSIIMKKPQREVLFWAGELARTGLHDQLWSLIWCIYYDFYAAAHPMLAVQIQEWHEQYMEIPNDESTARAVCNLHSRTPRTEVFESRLYSQAGGQVKPREFKTLDALWRSGTLVEIGSFIYTTEMDTVLLMQSLTNSFPNRILPGTTDSNYDRRHVLLACACSARLAISEVVTKLLVVDVLDATIESMQDIGSFEDTSQYHYLTSRRWIESDKRLGCFALPRFQLERPLTEHLWFHWEYHAALSPLWKARFAEHGGTPDHETKQVVFKTHPNLEPEDAEESFFQQWNILPDEQPKEIQSRASGQIINVTYTRWFRETFNKSPCLQISKPVKYNW